MKNYLLNIMFNILINNGYRLLKPVDKTKLRDFKRGHATKAFLERKYRIPYWCITVDMEILYSKNNNVTREELILLRPKYRKNPHLVETAYKNFILPEIR